MQKVKFHAVDLTKINGRGEFKCPNCGIEISPDDMTEEKFTILDTVMKGYGMEKIILRCSKCGGQIHLTGFNLLNKME